MPVFVYKAYDAGRSIISGSRAADTPAAGRQILRQQGLQLIEFGAQRFRPKFSLPIKGGHSRRREQVADFARHLAMLRDPWGFALQLASRSTPMI